MKNILELKLFTLACERSEVNGLSASKINENLFVCFGKGIILASCSVTWWVWSKPNYAESSFNSHDSLLFSEPLDSKCFCNCYHTKSARSESHRFLRYCGSDLWGVRIAMSFEVIIAEQIYISYNIWPNWLTDYWGRLPFDLLQFSMTGQLSALLKA